MLSYRHAFHAGNHADVLKHCVLLQLMEYFGRKDKPYWYIDTHAGAGIYSLAEGYATKNGEFESGIGRLWQRGDLPPALQTYVDAVASINEDEKLVYYPGSPWVAWQAIRDIDRMRLFELHPSDCQLLQANFEGSGRQVLIEKADGFDGLKAMLPPPPRRAVVLIDPPYEDKRDYARVCSSLKEALKRFATGCYAIWFPLLQRAESRDLLQQLRAVTPGDWLYTSLTVNTPSADGFGMHGSALYIVNPPYNLPATLQHVLPYLVEHLGLDRGAGFELQHQIS
ncbi:MAG: hypothetical protein RL210_957 [Pseudomonadota bacterium]|jgi:23S rRNA (adenine2030-N6)-methyltransferase